MSVRPFYNKFRAAIAINGENIQRYFKTEIEAKDFIKRETEKNEKIKPKWAICTKKRSTAKDQSLPVGYFDSESARDLASGNTVFYKAIGCSFKLNGKIKVVRRSYGIRRSRKEAIIEVEKVVLKKLNE